MAKREIVRVTFSLDGEVFKALEEAAKIQRRTNSGMANWVLARQFLGGEDVPPPADIAEDDD